MATYKGLGFDTTSARYRIGTSLDDITFVADITAQNGIGVTTGGLTVTAGGVTITAGGLDLNAGGADIVGGLVTDTLTVSGDASIGGDLTVTGDIVSRGAVNLVVEDNFIDLNFGNTTITSESGGLTISMNRTAGFTASTVTTFVAGIASTSNPTFTNTDATGSTALAAADIVMIVGATQEGNNGLYEVSAVNQATFPQTVTIKGIGTAAVSGSLPFCQTQFEAEAGASASAMKIDLAVWAVADGTVNFKDSAGSPYAKGTFITNYATAAVLTNFNANGSYTVATSTLQSAYNGGATITTASSTDIAFTLAAGDFTASGTGAVSLTPTAASTFTSAAALTLTSGAAATWSTGAGVLTLDGAAGVTLAGNSDAITVTGDSLDVNTDITANGSITLDGAAAQLISKAADADADDLTISLTGNHDSSILISSEGSGTDALTLQTINNGGDLKVSAAGNAGISGTTCTMDASAGGVSIEASSTSDLTVAANVATDVALTVSAKNTNAGGAATLALKSDNFYTSFGIVGGTGNVALGDVCYIENSSGTPRIVKAQANAIATSKVAGICVTAAVAGAASDLATAGVVAVTADASVAVSFQGSYVYLDAVNPGKVTLTPPSSLNSCVVQVGIVAAAAGSTAITIIVQPAFLLENG